MSVSRSNTAAGSQMKVEPPVQAQRFARVIEIVGRDDAQVAAARIRFKHYRDAGCDVSHHDRSAAG